MKTIVLFLCLFCCVLGSADEFNVSNNTTNYFWLKVDYLWRQVPPGNSLHFAGTGSTAEFYLDQGAVSPLSIHIIRTSDGVATYQFDPTWIPHFTLDFDGTNYFATAWQYRTVVNGFKWGFGLMCSFFLPALLMRLVGKIPRGNPEID